MKKILLVLSLAAAFTGMPSFAAAPAATATDPRTAAAVKSMLDAMEVRKATQAYFAEVEKTMPVMLRQQIEATIKADPAMSAAKKAEALAKMEKALPAITGAIGRMFRDPALVDEIMNEMVPLYASHFTTAEINELAAFYRTPLGRKMTATMPKLAAEGMMIGQKIVTPRLGKMMQDMMQELQKQ